MACKDNLEDWTKMNHKLQHRTETNGEKYQSEVPRMPPRLDKESGNEKKRNELVILKT